MTLTKAGINDDGELYLVFDECKFVCALVQEGDTQEEVVDSLQRLAVDVQNAGGE